MRLACVDLRWTWDCEESLVESVVMCMRSDGAWVSDVGEVAVHGPNLQNMGHSAGHDRSARR
jgi:hypothetical protein